MAVFIEKPLGVMFTKGFGYFFQKVDAVFSRVSGFCLFRFYSERTFCINPVFFDTMLGIWGLYCSIGPTQKGVN